MWSFIDLIHAKYSLWFAVILQILVLLNCLHKKKKRIRVRMYGPSVMSYETNSPPSPPDNKNSAYIMLPKSKSKSLQVDTTMPSKTRSNVDNQKDGNKKPAPEPPTRGKLGTKQSGETEEVVELQKRPHTRTDANSNEQNDEPGNAEAANSIVRTPLKNTQESTITLTKEGLGNTNTINSRDPIGSRDPIHSPAPRAPAKMPSKAPINDSVPGSTLKERTRTLTQDIQKSKDGSDKTLLTTKSITPGSTPQKSGRRRKAERTQTSQVQVTFSADDSDKRKRIVEEDRTQRSQHSLIAHKTQMKSVASQITVPSERNSIGEKTDDADTKNTSEEKTKKTPAQTKPRKKGSKSEKTQRTTMLTAGVVEESDKLLPQKMGESVDAITLSALNLFWDNTTKTQTMTLTNISEGKRACKIKCSDNKLYNVTPVFFMIDPKASQTLTFTRTQDVNKQDKFLLLHVKTDKSTAQEAFAAIKKDDKDICIVTINTTQAEAEQKSYLPTMAMTPL